MPDTYPSRCILIAGKIRNDKSGMYGVIMVWASYLVKYLSEPYNFGIIRKTRLQYNYVCTEKLKKKKKKKKKLSFLVFGISGKIRDYLWVKWGSDGLGFISHLLLIRIL